MKITTKIKKYYWFVITSLFIIPNIVWGQPTGNNSNTGGATGNNSNTSGQTGQYTFQNPINVSSLPQLINNIFDAIIQIGLIFVVLAIIYAGLQFILAQGNPEKISKAKSVFLWTMIGGVVLLGAGAISEVVCNTANQFLTTKIEC